MHVALLTVTAPTKSSYSVERQEVGEKPKNYAAMIPFCLCRLEVKQRVIMVVKMKKKNKITAAVADNPTIEIESYIGFVSAQLFWAY